MVGRTTAMRHSNKGNSEADCVLNRGLLEVFKVRTPREPGAHDLILQERIVPAGFSFGEVDQPTRRISDVDLTSGPIFICTQASRPETG